jgi:basic membrane lipoprotein Med (substrate-binding protein (PBP1-ABC) superfamily)
VFAGRSNPELGERIADLQAFAKEFPKAFFVVVGGRTTDTNLTPIQFKAGEATYLAGMLAGGMTKTGKVACVGGSEIPIVKEAFASFEKGVKAAKADAEVKIVFTGSGDDIAKAKGFSMEQMITEIETIVSSGTKLNLNYYIDELIDEDRQDEVFDYFRQADSDSIDSALSDLGEEDYTREEIQLMRIKFMSELGN